MMLHRIVYGAMSESNVRPATGERRFPDFISAPNPCTRGNPCSGFLYLERKLGERSAISVIGHAAARIVTHLDPCFTLSRPYFLAISRAFGLTGGILYGSSPHRAHSHPVFRTLVPATATSKRVPPSRKRELKNDQCPRGTTNTDLTLFRGGQSLSSV
jgi:hypothetical protein